MTAFRRRVWALLLVAAAVLTPAWGQREVASLNGLWDFALDPDDVGRAQGWQTRPPQTRSVRLPACWEERGVAPGYDGIGWYFKRLPAGITTEGRAVRLAFAGVSRQCEVFVGGQLVAEHIGAYEPFEVAIPDGILGTERTLLAVRVDDRIDDPLGPTPADQFGGIWGSVELIGTPMPYIAGVDTSFDAAARVLSCAARVEGNQTGHTLELELADSGGRALAAAEGKGPVALALPAAVRLWSPESPMVHTLRCRLRGPDGGLVDELAQPVCLRELAVVGGRLQFNGSPVPVRAVRYEGRYPHSLGRPPSEEFIRRDLSMIRRAGLNALKLRQPRATDVVRHTADALGLIILDDLGESLSALRIPRLSAGGLPEFDGLAGRYARAEQTWNAHSRAYEHHLACQSAIDTGLALFPFPTTPAPPGAAMTRVDSGTRKRHFYAASRELQAQWLRQAIDSQRLDPTSPGFIIASWEDWVGATGPGLVEVTRAPKPAYTAVAEALSATRVVLAVEPGLAALGASVDVEAGLMSDVPLPHDAAVTITATAPSGREHAVLSLAVAGEPLPIVWHAEPFRLGEPGLWTITAACRGAGDRLARDEAELLVLDPATAPAIRNPILAVAEMPGLTAALAELGVRTEAMPAELTTPRVLLLPDTSGMALERFIDPFERARALAQRGCVLVVLAQDDERAVGALGWPLADPVGDLHAGMTLMPDHPIFEGLRLRTTLDLMPGAEALLPEVVLTWPETMPTGPKTGVPTARNIVPHFGVSAPAAGTLQLWGSAVSLLTEGAGHIVLCQLPLEASVRNAGAGRVLLNLLAWSERLLPRELAPPRPSPTIDAAPAAPVAAGQGAAAGVLVSRPIVGASSEVLREELTPEKRLAQGLPASPPSPLAGLMRPEQTGAASGPEVIFDPAPATVDDSSLAFALPSPEGLGLGEAAVAYIVTYAHVPRRAVVRMSVGYARPYRAWIDGAPLSPYAARNVLALDAGWHEIVIKAVCPRSDDDPSLTLTLTPEAQTTAPPLAATRTTIEAEDRPVCVPEGALRLTDGGIVLSHGSGARVSWAVPTTAAGRYDVWLRYRARLDARAALGMSGQSLDAMLTASHEWRWLKVGRLALEPRLPITFAPQPGASTEPIGERLSINLTLTAGEPAIDKIVLAPDPWMPED